MAIRTRLLEYLRGKSPEQAALLTALSITGVSLIMGLLLSLVGPLYTAIIVITLVAAWWTLLKLENALAAVVVICFILPYATLPFKILITPTFLDLALGALYFHYLVQWMTGVRRKLRFAPVHPFVFVFMLVSIFSFTAGLRYAGVTSNSLRKFAEMLLSMGLVFVVVDSLVTGQQLRRYLWIVVIGGAIAGSIAILLWVLPDTVAEGILVRLSVIGYPNGGVIQYIEQNPELGERAIGTSIEPNALGGLLCIAATCGIALFKSIDDRRELGLLFFAIAIMLTALVLTFGRGAMIAFGVGVLIVAALKSPRLLWGIPVFLVVLIFAPVAQTYIERFASGLQGLDLATQMRWGEYKDALILIGRYPLIGVGFTGTPDIDIYLGVSNMYLTIASNMGILGLVTFLILIAATLAFSWSANKEEAGLSVGIAVVIVEILIIGIFDHYFFNLEFHHMATLFWLIVGFAIAAPMIMRTTGPTKA